MLHILSLSINKVKKNNYFLIPFFLLSILFIVIPTVIIFYFAFFSSAAKPFNQQLEIIEKHIVLSIIRSFYVASATMLFSLLIGYPVAYFVYEYRSLKLQNFFILMVSFPIWSNFFIKLIGVKSCFDFVNNSANSTYGTIYTIIGLVYIYMPLAVLTIYNSIKNISQNLIFSSQDLGSTKFEVLVYIIIPWTRNAIIATVALIFFPAFFSVTASEFLNNQNSSRLIAETLNNLATTSFNSDYGKSQLCFLVVFIAFCTLVLFLFCKLVPKWLGNIQLLFKKC